MEYRTNSFQEAEDKPGELPMGVSSDITAVPCHLTGRVRMHTLAPSHLDTCLLWVLSAPSLGLSLLTRMPHRPQLLAGPHQQPLCSGFPFATSTHPLPSLFTLLPASGVWPSCEHHHPPGIWMSKRWGQAPSEALSHLPCYLWEGTSHPITITHEMHPFCVNVNKDPPTAPNSPGNKTHGHSCFSWEQAVWNSLLKTHHFYGGCMCLEIAYGNSVCTSCSLLLWT